MSRVRRTQAERTATTRGALLEATISSLVEAGYGRTTTTDVARRAGVSPGALLHHFPTKADLLCAAMGRLFDQRTEEFRKAMADLEPGADRVAAALDLLWSLFDGPTFVAWTELWVAARNDPELAAPLIELDQKFMASSESTFREFFADEVSADPALAQIALGLSFAVMNGLALCRLLPSYDPLNAQQILDAFKALAQLALPTGDVT